MSAPDPHSLGTLLCGAQRLPGTTGRSRRFRAGEVLFSAGEAGDGFYIIESGRVQITASVGGGEPHLLATLGPGETVGEMAVLDDGPRSATARAETDTETQHMGRGELLRLLAEKPDLALSLIRELSSRMRTLNAKYVSEVVQAEKLAIVGRFARTIVHDLKSPLTVIGLAADLGCNDRTTPADRRKAKGYIDKQVGLITGMLQELIDFTMPSGQRLTLRSVVFSRFLVSLAAEFRQELAEARVALVLEHDPPAVKVRIDARRLARLFRNLLRNAVDAMPDGGQIFLRFQRAPGELSVTVEDTGRGIAPEIAAALFTPFATHGKAHGTGLGLTICRRIIEDHGGKIWAVAGVPGKGAAFSFTLPLAE